MKKLPAIGARVKLNATAHARLGARRARNPDVVGTVLELVAGRRDTRALVEWDKPAGLKEPIHPVYLEEASK